MAAGSLPLLDMLPPTWEDMKERLKREMTQAITQAIKEEMERMFEGLREEGKERKEMEKVDLQKPETTKGSLGEDLEKNGIVKPAEACVMHSGSTLEAQMLDMGDTCWPNLWTAAQIENFGDISLIQGRAKDAATQMVYNKGDLDYFLEIVDSRKKFKVEKNREIMEIKPDRDEDPRFHIPTQTMDNQIVGQEIDGISIYLIKKEKDFKRKTKFKCGG